MGDFENRFGSLKVIRSSKKFRQVYINPLCAENVKKLGCYHPKSQVLGLQKPNLSQKLAQEAFFKGLKINFLSDKTPIFFTFSDHKGLI